MPPVKVGKYTLREKWYQGIGVSVHLATKDGERCRYALKVLDGEAATLPGIQRLRREYQVAKDLPIHGIIPPNEMLEEGGTIALVLEDIDGWSLREQLKEGRMPFIPIVDDQEAHRRMMMEIIRSSFRAEFMEADDGGEALAIVDGVTPSFIVTDLNMPVMDGMEFMEKLRARPGLSSVPVVAPEFLGIIRKSLGKDQ